MPEYQSSPGMRDLLPPDSARWRGFVERFAATVMPAGYGLVAPPLLEDLGVFQRVGETTDVVSKEMYDFVDKGGRHVALRPEQTAGVCRAFVQHRPATPWKVWYHGPNFRYEKPQRGRFRQFDQVGVEALGSDDPYLDVEVITLAWDFFASLGLKRVRLVLNSLGEPEDRVRYMQELASWLGERREELSKESQETLVRNPLRVLDSKRESDQALVAAAPRIHDFWSPAAAAHFADVRRGLDHLGVPYVVDDHLVRGLDYYRRTTFEFQGLTLDSAQNALGGGGRYDGLVEDLGGPPTPGVGFALGVDRTLIACEDEGVFAVADPSPTVFVVDTTGGFQAMLICAELRRAGVAVARSFDQRSMKSQMKSADRSGARLAVIVGTEEVETDTVIIRALEHATQESVARNLLVEHLRRTSA